jgi:hypothetical protein
LAEGGTWKKRRLSSPPREAARQRALAAAGTAAQPQLCSAAARPQQPASCATLLVVRLLRWGELVRWKATAGYGGQQRQIGYRRAYSLSSLLVEATIIHHFNTYTKITATKAKPFTDYTQADITSSSQASQASPPSTTRRPGTCLSTSSLPTPWGSPTRRSSTVLPLTSSRAQVNTIPATTSSPAQCARRISNIASTTPSERQTGSIFSPLALSRRRAGTEPLPRRCTCSSPSNFATRVCRRPCSWAGSTGTSRWRFSGARCPSEYTCS